MRTIALLLAAFVLVACSAFKPTATEPPACNPRRLAELEGLYMAEVLVLCKGYELETCPAVPEIERHHQARVQEWIQCR